MRWQRVDGCGGTRKGYPCQAAPRYRITYTDGVRTWHVYRCSLHAPLTITADLRDDLAGWDQVRVEMAHAAA